MPTLWGNTLHLSLIDVQEFVKYNELRPKAAVQIIGFGIRQSVTLQGKSL
jgi:hypothetical protein